MPASADWTIAMDDAMVERFRRCTLCLDGRQARLLIRERGTHGLAVTLCARCDRQDPQQMRLDALLRQRYAPGRFPPGA